MIDISTYLTGKLDQFETALNAGDIPAALRVLQSIGDDGYPHAVAVILRHLITDWPQVANLLLDDELPEEPPDRAWIIRAGGHQGDMYWRNDATAPNAINRWLNVQTGEWIYWGTVVNLTAGTGQCVLAGDAKQMKGEMP